MQCSKAVTTPRSRVRRSSRPVSVKDNSPPEIEKKVRRYKALWKAQFGGEVALMPIFIRHSPKLHRSKLGAIDRRLALFPIAFKDAVPRVAYSIVPLLALDMVSLNEI